MPISGFDPNKFIKLEIDHTKIDNIIENFPLSITISNNSGINNYDCKQLIEDLKITDVNDDFTGPDGSLPNTFLWDPNGFNQGYIKNNTFYVNDNTSSARSASNLSSIFLFRGDFDIQADFVLYNHSGSNGLAFYSGSAKNNYHLYIIRDCNSGGNDRMRITSANYDWSNYQESTWSISPGTFKFRWVRSGTTIKAYVWYNNQWQWGGSTDGYTYPQTVNGDFHLSIVMQRIGDKDSGSLEACTDNFKVNSGNIIWPQKNHPNRKKIAVEFAGFKEHQMASIDDSFDGNSGDTPNTLLWDNNGTTIYNSQLLFDGNTSKYVRSKYSLSHNSSIQVDFDINSSPSTTAHAIGLSICNQNNDTIAKISIRLESDGYYYYRVHELADGTWNLRYSNSTTDKTGTFKIEAKRNKIYYYYYSGGTWVFAHVSSINLPIFFVELKSEVWDNNPSINSLMDNFKLNYGEIDWGTNSKNMVTISSPAAEECPVEIEWFDPENNIIQLWTKVPIIASEVPTKLYLYYDSNTNDNINNVGDIGESPAQNVWDNNFVFVSHQSTSPTDTIFDSTTYGSTGTSGGSMTDDDLVSDCIAKAINFDGNDDYIYFSPNTAQDITDYFTLQAIIKPSKILDNNLTKLAPILSRQGYPDSNDNDTYAIVINVDGELQLGTSGGNIQSSKASWQANNEYYVHGTYAIDLFGELFINGITEILSTDNYDAMSGSSNGILVGAFYDNDHFFPGTLDELRISNTVRTNYWIKADYYSCSDQLLTFNYEEFKFCGYVTVESIPAIRKVHLYHRDSGILIGSTISNGVDGYFEISSPYKEDHFVVILPDINENYNLLAYDKINPEN